MSLAHRGFVLALSIGGFLSLALLLGLFLEVTPLALPFMLSAATGAGLVSWLFVRLSAQGTSDVDDK